MLEQPDGKENDLKQEKHQLSSNSIETVNLSGSLDQMHTAQISVEEDVEAVPVKEYQSIDTKSVYANKNNEPYSA